jgi:UDP-N-acetyl-2-amino-2-deoxyglucuronate dehydrogenase
MKKFAFTGVGGYIAPRHLKAIRDTGNVLVAAVDPNDSVGILDQFSYDTRFFQEFERFDRHLEKLRRKGETEKVHYVSICSPNYLHDAHIRFALRIGAHAICEKPLVINPWNLDPLQEMEKESGKKIFTILQLRLLPSLIAIKNRIAADNKKSKFNIVLTYITSRGNWYHNSWKGDVTRSGGITTNIGIHFFDLLLWLFGKPEGSEVHALTPFTAAGYLELERATVKWFLSIDKNNLPKIAVNNNKFTFRSITIDDEELEFSDGFTDLHTALYRNILEGNGFGIEDARPSIELVHQIRNAVPTGRTFQSHNFLI